MMMVTKARIFVIIFVNQSRSIPNMARKGDRTVEQNRLYYTKIKESMAGSRSGSVFVFLHEKNTSPPLPLGPRAHIGDSGKRSPSEGSILLVKVVSCSEL